MARRRSFSLPRLGVLLAALVPATLPAATYTVGPSGRQYTQLTTLVDSVDLAPGDIVLVDGNATYNGGIVVGDDDSGASGNPVTIRWTRAAGETRPLLQGGSSTIKFEQSHFVTLEGFDITGGSFACVFNEANGTLVRDVLVRDCPSHGILGADQNSGSFTLEYSEVRGSGSGTTRHSMYMQNDQVLYPDAVFRMRYNYVHDGNGGILMRTRYSRSEIYYNWFESSTNEEVEFIGPDCEAQKASWTPDLVREDTDFVGNVIIHTSTWRNAIRTGGDLVGRNQGRVRLVNNTIIFDRPGTANAVRVQLGTDSVEMHNNVIHQTGSSVPNVLEENYDVATPYCAPFDTDPWSSGRKVAGSNNWVKSGSNMVPPEWTATRSGADPGFEHLANRRLRPSAASPLADGGNGQPQTPGAFPFPSPLLLPAFDPPQRVKSGLNVRHARAVVGARIDIGALEQAGSGAIPRNGSRPLLPPRPARPPSQNGEAATPRPSGSASVQGSPVERAGAMTSGYAGFRPSPWLGALVAWPLPAFLWAGSPGLWFWLRTLF